MKMALLKSVKDVPNIDYYEYRNTEFYNKYTYRAKLSIPGLGYTYYVKTLEELVDRVHEKGYRRIPLSRKTDVVANLEKLCAFVDWRNTHKKPGHVTFRVEQDSAAVYSNDLELLLTLKEFCPDIKTTKTQLEQFAGTKYFINKPKHNYRIYLKSAYIKDKNFIKDLADTVKKSKELVPSNALNYWLKSFNPNNSQLWRYTYTSSTHSIDYDNESTLSYLMLMYGDMLGKRYKLEKRPDPV